MPKCVQSSTAGILRVALPEPANARADLTIEVRDLEAVEVRDREAAHPEARQGYQMSAAHTTEPGDRHAGFAQAFALGFADPAERARESCFSFVARFFQHRKVT